MIPGNDMLTRTSLRTPKAAAIAGIIISSVRRCRLPTLSACEEAGLLRGRRWQLLAQTSSSPRF